MTAKTYRKKPVKIQAIQLTWANWEAVCDFIGDALNDVPGQSGAALSDEYSDTCGEKGQYIKLMLLTTHGEPAVFRHGDWIIPDSKPNTFYPCKPDIFAKTYEELHA